MNIAIINNSIKTFIPQQIVCLSYKFFSQFVTKDQLVDELKEFLPQILDNIVQECLLSHIDVENFKNVRIFNVNSTLKKLSIYYNLGS